MTQLLRFSLPDGGDVLVEAAEEVAAGPTRAGSLAGATERASQTFQDALSGVRGAAEAGLREFREMVDRPEKVEVEFQVRLTAETGAVIVRAAGAAHLTVRLTWGSPEA